MRKTRDWNLGRFASVLLAMFLAACTMPARYVLVTSRSDVDFSDGSRRFICLTAEEAKRMPGLIDLWDQSDIRRYGKQRSGNDPLEDILFHLVQNDFTAAGARLEREGQSVPEDLRLLLQADILYETDMGMPRDRLTGYYQSAFEKQSCELSKDLILLRIRQLRYGR